MAYCFTNNTSAGKVVKELLHVILTDIVIIQILGLDEKLLYLNTESVFKFQLPIYINITTVNEGTYPTSMQN